MVRLLRLSYFVGIRWNLVATGEGPLSPRLRLADDQLAELGPADFPAALQPAFATLTEGWHALLVQRLGRPVRLQRSCEVVTALLALYDEVVRACLTAGGAPPAAGRPAP